MVMMMMHRLLFHRAHHHVAQYIRLLVGPLLLLSIRGCLGVSSRGMFAADIFILWLELRWRGGRRRAIRSDIEPVASTRGK
jgi:hypothetical protein